MNDALVGKIVELQEHAADLYRKADTGWRGLVKDQKVDDGFDMVWIEWDRDHWLWEPGQDDGWAYASHFKTIGEKSVTDMVKDAIDQVDSELSQADPNQAKRQQLQEIFDSVAADVQEADGFIIIWAKNQMIDDRKVIAPHRVSGAIDAPTAAIMESEALALVREVMTKMIIEKVQDVYGR